MSRPAAAMMAAAGLRLRVQPPRATVEFDAVDSPAHGGPASFAAALVEAGRQLTGDVRVVVVSGATWRRAAPTSPDPCELPEPWEPPAASTGLSETVDVDEPDHSVLNPPARTGAAFGPSGWLSARPDLFSVAILHGEVSGFGLALALACDLRVAAEDTRLTWLGAAAGAQTDRAAADLVAAVGYARALEWSVVGATVAADRAVELGLLTRLAPVAAVGAATGALVDALLAVPRERAVEAKARMIAGRRVGVDRTGARGG